MDLNLKTNNTPGDPPIQAPAFQVRPVRTIYKVCVHIRGFSVLDVSALRCKGKVFANLQVRPSVFGRSPTGFN